jgi:selenium metabolism protein YedF
MFREKSGRMIKMTRTVDARGLNCPQPVILTKRAMDENSGEEILTMVDNSAALENVCKLAASLNYNYAIEAQGSESHIRICPPENPHPDKDRPQPAMVILVKTQYFGQGDDELGALLTKSFFYALTEMGSELQALIFMNGGVHLTTAGSPVMEHLLFLEQQGVQILSCGTCLDFFAKKEQLQVGQVTNMYTATELLARAAKTLVI